MNATLGLSEAQAKQICHSDLRCRVIRILNEQRQMDLRALADEVAYREQLALACRHGVGSKTAYGCGMVVPVPTPTLDPGEAVVWAAGQAFDETPGVTTPDVNPSEVTAHVDV
jgi:hypothetical protein